MQNRMKNIEDRIQKIEYRRQNTEDRIQKIEDRRYCLGKTPMETFIESLPLAKQKLLNESQTAA